MKRGDKILAVVCLLLLGFALDAQQVINGYRVLVNIAAASVSTPASGSTAIYVDSTTKQLATKDDSGTVVNYTSGGGGGSNVPLAISGPQTAIVGTGAATAVYSYTLPANTLASNGCLLITVGFKHTTGSASVSYNWTYGGGNLGGAALFASTSTAFGSTQLFWCNNNSTSTQYVLGTNTFVGANAFSPSAATTGQTTTGTVTFAFNFNVASTDQVTPEFWSVNLY